MAKPIKFSDGTTLKEILDAASAGYPDEFLSNYYDASGKKAKGSGDTMAEFIVIEIRDTILDAIAEKQSSVEALNETIRRLETAQSDLGNVISHLYAMRERLG